MKEIRITFGSEDFAAVTKHMIDLGVLFQVEPLGSDEGEGASHPPAAPRRRETKRKQGKGGRQSGIAEPERESAAAARLRAMAERNRAASGRSVDDAGDNSPSANSPFDET